MLDTISELNRENELDVIGKDNVTVQLNGTVIVRANIFFIQAE